MKLSRVSIAGSDRATVVSRPGGIPRSPDRHRTLSCGSPSDDPRGVLARRPWEAAHCRAVLPGILSACQITPEPVDRSGGHDVFDYSQDFAAIDFRKRPDLYRIGRGEQGVLLVEPYKSELLPHWTFKTVAEARSSSAKLSAMFEDYLAAGDFPGADMARKFLQMGWTRARR